MLYSIEYNMIARISYFVQSFHLKMALIQKYEKYFSVQIQSSTTSFLKIQFIFEGHSSCTQNKNQLCFIQIKTR